ncbi:DsbA family protein [Novosphingobium aquimarinum]|uniref:DsbA family protein n=1 Tax=Novosphingobium aquimarinum TaxID=2682494 RepID=UPI0012EB2B58|nr:thioredoxin domain-containing protein [Novosphingobium aquimarinum]
MRRTKLTLLAAAALLATGAAPHANWTATVTEKPNGAHVLGNPAAKVKLTEFVSYTCPHCAHFNQDSEAILRMTYVPQGKVSVAVHHVVRDPIDLTVAMLTNCGDDKMFFKKHSAFLASQDQWLGKVDSFSEAQRQRWSAGPITGRMKAIANDFGFYTMMERWGFDRVATDKCLADQAMTKRLIDLTEEAAALGVNSTPSFSIDGSVLTGTHDWQTLEQQIKARI